MPALLLACVAYLSVALPGSTLGLLWPSIRPRVSVTSNQSRLCRVFEARPTAPLMASSMLSVEEPTISLIE